MPSDINDTKAGLVDHVERWVDDVRDGGTTHLEPWMWFVADDAGLSVNAVAKAIAPNAATSAVDHVERELREQILNASKHQVKTYYAAFSVYINQK